MNTETPQCNETTEVNQDAHRNITPMIIDGVIYLVSLSFSDSAAHTLSDRLKAFIYRDIRDEIAVSENLS